MTTTTTAAPRLNPRTISSSNPSLHSSLARGTTGHLGAVYDPWGSCWNTGHGWRSPWYSRNCGYGIFGFSWPLWTPFWCYDNFYWDIGYSNCWWHRWSHRYCASTSYWWYPSAYYCPTYLYVPSTVVVAETYEPAVAPAAAPAAPEVPGAADRGLPAAELAKKYVELGDFYFKAGRFPEAADSYARARTYAPDDATVHFVLADAAFATGDYHFAAFLIGEALRLDPSLATADTDKRLFYGDVKLFEQQMKELDDYLASKPYDALAELVRGYNLRFSGKPAAAIESFRRVLEIAPDNRTATIFLATLAPSDAAVPGIR